MVLAKTGTCISCGYEKIHCICNNQNQRGTTYHRNTSGEVARYQHFQDPDNYNDFSQTSRVATQTDERKFMEELFPVNNETADIYLARTDISANKLIESSMYKHIYGGRKPWPSHSSSRYCPICTLCQHVETYRQILQGISEIQDISLIKFKVETGVTPLHTKITLVSLSDPAT